jgi:hypothetical protein
MANNRFLVFIGTLVMALVMGACSEKATKAADFETWNSEDGTVSITKYIGNAAAVVIPAKIGGKKVTAIGPKAFADRPVKKLTLPDSVTEIGADAFSGTKLTGLDYSDGEKRHKQGIYRIGETGPGGGVVFYDKGEKLDGWRYLEATPGDLGEAKWGAYNKYVSGTGTDIGTGQKNTQIIVAFLNQAGETGCAAQMCDAYSLNGKDDWFLPSKDELNQMYLSGLKEQGLGGFKDGWRWSSSAYRNYYAWYQNCSDGFQLANLKNFTAYVRGVRAF